MTSVASEVPFADLCELLERISNKPGKENKMKLLNAFIGSWRSFHKKLHKDEETDDTFYPAMRLLIPHLEKERGAYGIKEHTLAKLYIEILNLNKESTDAMKLLQYKNSKTAKSEAGDFSTVAYFVLKNRCPEKGTLFIEDVNQLLDAVALGNAEKNKNSVNSSLRKLLRSTSAKEQKWLIRMIMKELKMGLSEQSVFAAFHPDARALFDVSSSLYKVCKKLHDPDVRLNEIDICLFEAFMPMLAERAAPNEIDKKLNGRPFFIENKFDGERMQLHKDGDKYMYFSRRGNEYTKAFGASSLEGTLTPFIHHAFRPDVNSCILDGEMICYDKNTNCVVTKAKEFDVKFLKETSYLQPCFYVFDIVFINGRVLTNSSLEDRVKNLEGIVANTPGRIEISTRRLATSREEVVEALNQAIDQREEGIVVKDSICTYLPNVRNGGGWLKLKPEYVDGLMDELDLLIIGGYFGEGRRSGIVSHFLLGVAVSPENEAEEPKMFYSLSRVGSGYSMQELYELLGKLSPHWQVFDSRKPPSCLGLLGNKYKPDVWIQPKNSYIVQVKATEIVNSDKFKAGCTLRFPRVEKVRYDKPWNQCLTTEELTILAKMAEGKLSSRHMVDEGEPSPKKRRTGTKEPYAALAVQFRGVKSDDIQKVSNLFSGMEMHVVNCPPSHTKNQIETLIIEHGGKVVQNPGPNTNIVLVEKEVVRAQNIIRSGKYDVVRHSWLLRCLEQKEKVKWNPGDILFAREETRKVLDEEFDKFGDSYMSDVTPESLRQIVENMKIPNKNELPTAREIEELECSKLPNGNPFAFLRNCRVLVENGESENAAKMDKLLLRFYGASVSKEVSADVTHILVQSGQSINIGKYKELNRSREKKFHLVTKDWLDSCVQRKKRLGERDFYP